MPHMTNENFLNFLLRLLRKFHVVRKTRQCNILVWLLSSIFFKPKFLLNKKKVKQNIEKEKDREGDTTLSHILSASDLSLFSIFSLFKSDFLLSLFLHTVLRIATLSVLIPHLNYSAFLDFVSWWDREPRNSFIIAPCWDLNSSLFHTPGCAFSNRVSHMVVNLEAQGSVCNFFHSDINICTYFAMSQWLQHHHLPLFGLINRSWSY